MLDSRSGKSSGRQWDVPAITWAQPGPETGREKAFPGNKVPSLLHQLVWELLLTQQLRPLLPTPCRGAWEQEHCRSPGTHPLT